MGNSISTTKVLLQMPKGMYSDLKAKAEKLNMPVNKLIRQMIYNGLESNCKTTIINTNIVKDDNLFVGAVWSREI